ncbi:hypothetical protein [Curtobacterium sp. S6]|uniref:hypothetical protein n=1 Tax=Curtobacterium sp. S6 TaxID=1479623 RepID=UPI0004AA86F8|nr:hypothetical protein [Curtobacterium sp. S6]
MRAPWWLRHPRQTSKPVLALSDATLGNLVVSTVIIVIIALPWGPSSAAPGAAFGAGLLTVSALVTWCVTRGVHRRGSDPAFYLLVAYVMKALIGVVAVFVVPFPRGWSGGWALGGAVVCVVVALGTQLWVIHRLRIPYFTKSSAISEDAPRAKGKRI